MSEQAELFSPVELHAGAAQVPGLTLKPDWIGPDEERDLIAHVDRGPWQTDWRRRIQQYGVGYSDRGGKPVWIRDFPDWLMPLAARVAKEARFQRFPENCVINEYIPPQGIAPHRDYSAFGPVIACVSLGSSIILDFTTVGREKRVPVYVPARSLWVITGEARSKWRHGIAPRLHDMVAGERRKRERRISITFRTAKSAAARETRS